MFGRSARATQNPTKILESAALLGAQSTGAQSTKILEFAALLGAQSTKILEFAALLGAQSTKILEFVNSLENFGNQLELQLQLQSCNSEEVITRL